MLKTLWAILGKQGGEKMPAEERCVLNTPTVWSRVLSQRVWCFKIEADVPRRGLSPDDSWIPTELRPQQVTVSWVVAGE